MPVSVVDLLLMLDDSVFPERKLDLSIGNVQSQKGNTSSAGHMEEPSFG